MIEAQLATGHESNNGFRDAFSRIIGTTSTKFNPDSIFKAAWIDTPLGPMLAISNEMALYLLEFVDRRGLEREIDQLCKKTNSAILPGSTDPILSIEKELAEYFKGKRMEFSTPFCTLGSAFQKRVWEKLRKIPPGQTRSYSQIAKAIGQPSACRAVARANSSNRLAIIIPCHRVINADGNLGGYAGGLLRKQRLLEQELHTIQGLESQDH